MPHGSCKPDARFLKVLLVFISVGLTSCEGRKEPPYQRIPLLGTVKGALTAYCDMDFTDRGRIDIERDYLPHVINCENGGASLEALKAQAVAARSYLYYKLHHVGSITDGQGDQVYSCGREPGPQHLEAVEATSGEVLTYQDEVIAAFYVAGAIPAPPMCIGTESDSDPHNTERYVTYNQGKTGADVTQTSLGWVNPGNIYNRGCKSQNGASCLSNSGVPYPDILRFYYGADITIERSTGECISQPVSMGGEIEAGELAGENAGGIDVEMVSGSDGPGGEQAAGADSAGSPSSQGGDWAGSSESPMGGSSGDPVPSDQGYCALTEGEQSFTFNDECAVPTCRGEQRWSGGGQMYTLTCGGDESCRGSWYFVAESAGRYAIGLDVVGSVLETDTSTGEGFSPWLNFEIESTGIANLEGSLEIAETGVTLLGVVQLTASQRVTVRAPSQCERGELNIYRLVVKKLTAFEEPTFGPRSATLRYDQGCDQAVFKKSQRLEMCLLVLFGMFFISRRIFQILRAYP